MKDKSKIVSTIISRLQKEFPDAKCALEHETPHQLLVSTILSAQCTDARVNMVTPSLFEKYKTVKDFASANQSELEKEIYSTGFYKNKAKAIIASSKTLLKKFHGNIPNTVEELTSLPGVGRKTANVVLGTAFNIATGIVVDTHVSRLSQRLGFTKQTNAEKIEEDLMKLIPKKHWIMFSHWLILHGRKTCDARKPKCNACVLNDVCPSVNKFS
ncbi:MAG: endonuclease III [Ignavibacteria bacterium]|nr:endonuclease III [Ignavibacteria bacterium]